MKLRLVGHDYKYAVEQIMLALFPEQKPDYSDDRILGSSDFITESHLHLCGTYAQATTIIKRGGDVSRGVARVRRDRLTGKLNSDRLLQRIVKQSFYRAAAAFLEAPPVWGSLTGIRPARIASAAIESGMSGESAARALSREYYVSPERAVMCVSAAQSSLALKRKLMQNDIALYVGIPFCPTRCAYCSFVSNSVEKSFGLIEPFMQALLLEIGKASEAAEKLGLRIVSLYIGGGTPTALPAESLKTLMETLRSSFDLSSLLDYTVEAGRPDTITAEKAEIMRGYGAKRVCVNPQSMSPDVLAAIGRMHTPDEIHEAVRLVRNGGADSVTALKADGAAGSGTALKAGGAAGSGVALNMDVIAGLPGDTPEGFIHTLDTVLAFKPENVTVHTLSLKKGSRIMLEGTKLPGGADVAEMLGYAAMRLSELGYSPYYLYRQKFTSGGFENTGWSLPGHEGIYNICMMEELCTVLALGGGGVTKLVSPNGRIERIFNAKYPREYIMKAEEQERKFGDIADFLT